MPRAPLPVRDGLNPTRLRLPADGPWDTVLDYLTSGFRGEIVNLDSKVAAREVVDEDGAPIDARTPFAPSTFIYLYRDPPPERPVPFEIEVLHRDDDLLVVDKPHFLATTPRGDFIVESATVRLRRAFDMPELSPAHRLDRVTAGVLVFTTRQSVRGAYQTMFARREVTKTYEAVAAFDPALTFPRTVRNRIVKRRGTPTAEEEPGPANSETVIELLAVRGALARYRLTPLTGKTHQLRLHMASLGVGIVNDAFYPDFLDPRADDYATPLQLLARSIAFDDPRTGERRVFESRRTLDSWQPDTASSD